MSKDKTRSIRLDGDVADIAQKLADDSQLSATISKLLRQHYGRHTEIDSIKQQLDRTVNERMLLQEEEKLLADKLDELEDVKMQRMITDLPHLERKIRDMEVLHKKTKDQWMNARDTQTRILKARAMKNQQQLLDAWNLELESLR